MPHAYRLETRAGINPYRTENNAICISSGGSPKSHLDSTVNKVKLMSVKP